MQLDDSDKQQVKDVLKSKVLQLASPFREKVAQRFASHYFSIGIEDDEIRHKDYIKAIKQYKSQLK